MSANETNTDQKADTPATAVQESAAPKTPAAPKQVSRLYARYRRDRASEATVTASSLSSDPVTTVDNLPVRATAPAHLVGDSDRTDDDRSERRERPERRERRDRSDGRERGRYRRDNDDRRDRSSRDERRHETPEPIEASESREDAGEPDVDHSAKIEKPEAEPNTGNTPSERKRRRRGPRFEEMSEGSSDRAHLIQEFKPSRHAQDSLRKPTTRKDTDEKKSSLMGWIKSVFTGGDETKETPTATPSRNPRQGNRGPRPQTGSGNRDGAPRRRRRGRRSGSGGGQNRRRQGGGNNRPRRDG